MVTLYFYQKDGVGLDGVSVVCLKQPENANQFHQFFSLNEAQLALFIKDYLSVEEGELSQEVLFSSPRKLKGIFPGPVFMQIDRYKNLEYNNIVQDGSNNSEDDNNNTTQNSLSVSDDSKDSSSNKNNDFEENDNNNNNNNNNNTTQNANNVIAKKKKYGGDDLFYSSDSDDSNNSEDDNNNNSGIAILAEQQSLKVVADDSEVSVRIMPVEKQLCKLKVVSANNEIDNMIDHSTVSLKKSELLSLKAHFGEMDLLGSLAGLSVDSDDIFPAKHFMFILKLPFDEDAGVLKTQLLAVRIRDYLNAIKDEMELEKIKTAFETLDSKNFQNQKIYNGEGTTHTFSLLMRITQLQMMHAVVSTKKYEGKLNNFEKQLTETGELSLLIKKIAQSVIKLTEVIEDYKKYLDPSRSNTPKQVFTKFGAFFAEDKGASTEITTENLLQKIREFQSGYLNTLASKGKFTVDMAKANDPTDIAFFTGEVCLLNKALFATNTNNNDSLNLK